MPLFAAGVLQLPGQSSPFPFNSPDFPEAFYPLSKNQDRSIFIEPELTVVCFRFSKTVI